MPNLRQVDNCLTWLACARTTTAQSTEAPVGHSPSPASPRVRVEMSAVSNGSSGRDGLPSPSNCTFTGGGSRAALGGDRRAEIGVVCAKQGRTNKPRRSEMLDDWTSGRPRRSIGPLHLLPPTALCLSRSLECASAHADQLASLTRRPPISPASLSLPHQIRCVPVAAPCGCIALASRHQWSQVVPTEPHLSHYRCENLCGRGDRKSVV